MPLDGKTLPETTRTKAQLFDLVEIKAGAGQIQQQVNPVKNNTYPFIIYNL